MTDSETVFDLKAIASLGLNGCVVLTGEIEFSHRMMFLEMSALRDMVPNGVGGYHGKLVDTEKGTPVWERDFFAVSYHDAADMVLSEAKRVLNLPSDADLALQDRLRAEVSAINGIFLGATANAAQMVGLDYQSITRAGGYREAARTSGLDHLSEAERNNADKLMACLDKFQVSHTALLAKAKKRYARITLMTDRAAKLITNP